MASIEENIDYAQQLAHIGYWTYDILKDKLILSSGIYDILDCNQEELGVNRESYYLYVYPDDLEKVKTAIQEALEGKEYDIEYRIIVKNGLERYVNSKAEVLHDENNNPVKIIGILQDISNSKLIEKNLKVIEEDLNLAQRVAGVGSWKYDALEDKFYGSEGMYRIYGIEPKDFKNNFNNAIKLIHPDDQAKALDAMKNHMEGKSCQFDFRIPQRDGTMKYVIGKGEPLFDEEGRFKGILGTLQDITDRAQMENKIAHFATHDELTDLPNRFYFKEKLEDIYQYSKEKKTSFAVMMLDIGEFRYINDALGYELGDELVKKIAKRLETFLGDNIFVGRYFGLQFAIILPELNSIEEYERMAIGIIHLFNKPFKIETYELYVTANIGISLYPEDSLDIDFIIKYANIALIRAKQSGKNVYKFYSSQMDIQSYKQFVLRNDLRKAIKDGQLRVYYQPLVNLETDEILATEALIRWEHPDWGMISPGEFIPIAEETGLIIDVGKWILKEVCRNYKKWLDAGMSNIKVSVNFSSVQFFEDKFVENIMSIIDEFNLDPHFLIMEITESIFMRETDKAISDIKRLKSYGIQLALDDFGTGFSSLSYLNLLDIDLLKIDGSFVRNIISDETSSVITKTIINMAQELNIKIVAEGIEYREQLSCLKKLRCYAGQGYIYSKPVPLEEFENILAKGKCHPTLTNNAKEKLYKERRRYFRIKFYRLLEANLTIKEFKGKKINVGNTKVLIKNIGAGGICFVSNLKLPVYNDIILQFATRLIEEEINICGYPVWIKDSENGLFEYGIEFKIDENERADLIKILNKVQIKMGKSTIFTEGDFISETAEQYFKLI